MIAKLGGHRWPRAILFVLLAACAVAQSDRARQTLTGISLTLSGAERALDAYQAPHEQAIVAEVRAACKGDPTFNACVEAKGRPLLAEFRLVRDRAIAAFATIYAAILVAEQAIAAAEIGGQKVDFNALLAPVVRLAGEIRSLLEAVGVAKGTP